jgi:hypothetical protein
MTNDTTTPTTQAATPMKAVRIAKIFKLDVPFYRPLYSQASQAFLDEIKAMSNTKVGIDGLLAMAHFRTEDYRNELATLGYGDTSIARTIPIQINNGTLDQYVGCAVYGKNWKRYHTFKQDKPRYFFNAEKPDPSWQLYYATPADRPSLILVGDPLMADFVARSITYNMPRYAIASTIGDVTDHDFKGLGNYKRVLIVRGNTEAGIKWQSEIAQVLKIRCKCKKVYGIKAFNANFPDRWSAMDGIPQNVTMDGMFSIMCRLV